MANPGSAAAGFVWFFAIAFFGLIIVANLFHALNVYAWIPIVLFIVGFALNRWNKGSPDQ